MDQPEAGHVLRMRPDTGPGPWSADHRSPRLDQEERDVGVDELRRDERAGSETRQSRGSRTRLRCYPPVAVIDHRSEAGRDSCEIDLLPGAGACGRSLVASLRVSVKGVPQQVPGDDPSDGAGPVGYVEPGDFTRRQLPGAMKHRLGGQR